MDDKMINYLITNALATNKCLDDIKDLSNVVVRQAKINRTQRLVNTVLGAMCVACVCNIADLIRVVKKQNTKIQELEAKVNGEEKEGE